MNMTNIDTCKKMNVIKGNKIYSGKSKTLYEVDGQPDYLISDFRDDITAFNALKHEKLAQKGTVNNQINAHVMKTLEKEGVPTHFKQLLSEHESLVQRLSMFPLESVVRNIAAGSICKRLGIEKGLKLDPPLQEFFYKNDELGDPLINDNHIICFGWATTQQISQIKSLTLKINDVLKKMFADADLVLVDAKYEFGTNSSGEILLGDEISPDSCRIWDAKTQETLDKDRYRYDMGEVIPAYIEVAKRLGIAIE